VVAAAATLFFGRGFFRELGRRIAFAFLVFLTLITVSVLTRAFQGGDRGWALAALALLGPALILAWRDWAKASR
jgi:hypothetical protein